MWDPQQYERFAGPRARPFFDLIERIPDHDPRTVVDLGCGTGRLTRTLLDRYPHATVTGIDNSPDMLAEAAPEPPRLTFQHADIQTWGPERPVDLIISNAALHWLPGHETLLPRLVSHLARPGTLAVHVPANNAAPSHTAVLTLLAEEPWRGLVGDAAPPPPVPSLDETHRILSPHVDELDAWDTIYEDTIASAAELAQWLAGTTLRPIIDALGPERSPRFLEELTVRLRAAYGDGTDIPYPFRRRFYIARVQERIDTA